MHVYAGSTRAALGCARSALRWSLSRKALPAHHCNVLRDVTRCSATAQAPLRLVTLSRWRCFKRCVSALERALWMQLPMLHCCHMQRSLSLRHHTLPSASAPITRACNPDGVKVHRVLALQLWVLRTPAA